MADEPEVAETARDPGTTPVSAATRSLSRGALFAIIGLSAGVLAALVVIVLLLLPRAGSDLASEPAAPLSSPTATPTVTPTATPSATPSPTPSPTQVPVAGAPAPVDPAPVAPAPVEPAPAPALPAPPAPVIPPLAINTMSATPQGACTTSTWIDVAWTSTGALDDMSSVNVRSGGGTPIFNQTWLEYNANDHVTINIDCTRPLWFFKLTVSGPTGTKSALLTFANGANQGWSSN